MREEFQRLVEYQEKGFLEMEMLGSRRPKTSQHVGSSKERSGSRFSNGRAESPKDKKNAG